jgi:hypothetical protein|nr:MAG TPA: hypothetical protein [Caudoviricetes sp.]DAO80800.1 MAG TPA: hypothetical protein [Caudoviricetes sp.]
MIYIEVPDMNDSISAISIQQKEYGIRFTYNEKYDYWSFGLYDVLENPLIAMTKIVPNFPLFHFYVDENLPDGIFGCISDVDKVGRNAFKERKAEFVYIPRKDLE